MGNLAPWQAAPSAALAFCNKNVKYRARSGAHADRQILHRGSMCANTRTVRQGAGKLVHNGIIGNLVKEFDRVP